VIRESNFEPDLATPLVADALDPTNERESVWNSRTYSNSINGCGTAPRTYRTFRENPADELGLPVLYVVNGSCTWYSDGYYWSNLARLYRDWRGKAVYVDGPDLDGSLSEDIMYDMRNEMIENCWAGHCDVALAGYSRGLYVVIAAYWKANNWLRDNGYPERIRAQLGTMAIDPVKSLIGGFTSDAPGPVIHFKKRRNCFFLAPCSVYNNGPLEGDIRVLERFDISHIAFTHDSEVRRKLRESINGLGAQIIGRVVSD